MKRSELTQSVISWNNRFPLDRWWRIKHNVAFMSPAHRESSFLEQLFEFEEDRLFIEGTQEETDKYVPGVGDFLKHSPTLEKFTEEAEQEIQNLLKQEEDGRRQEDTGND